MSKVWVMGIGMYNIDTILIFVSNNPFPKKWMFPKKSPHKNTKANK